MKTYIFIIAIIILTANSLILSAQNQVPDPGFENWTNQNTASDWNVEHIGISIFNFYSAQRTSDAFSGNYAAQINSQSILNLYTIPGYISLGHIDMESFIPYGGISFSDRPTGMSFRYKYAPVSGDSMAVFIVLTKWNSDSQKRDTVGGNIFVSDETVNTYKLEQIPVYYMSLDTPDTLNIGFASSGFSPHAGSSLTVDDVLLSNEQTEYPPVALPALDTSSVGFTAAWIPVFYADNYILDVARDPEFTDFVEGYENLNLIGGLNYSQIINVPQPTICYYRIKIVYPSNETDFSDTISVPMPVECLDAQNIETNSFSAVWQNAEGETGYCIQIARDADFSDILPNYNCLNISTNETNVLVEGLAENTEYFYRVRTNYDNAESRYSNVVSLRTSQSTGISAQRNNGILFRQSGKLLSVTNSEETPGILRIYSPDGRIVEQTEIETNGRKEIYSDSGIFILDFRTEKKCFVEKIYIE